jgi:F5/8 type C domain
VTTDRIRVKVTGALGGYSRITEIEAWTSSTTNVAASGNGGVASASSSYGGAYPVSAINNGERAGAGWCSGGGWADATNNAYPDWVQVTFSGQQTIDQVVVYTVQDNWASPVEPDDTSTFASWGVSGFQVQAWNGSAWNTVATVTGNNLVKRQVMFPSVTTDRVRVNVTSALGGYSRITELEAWTAP